MIQRPSLLVDPKIVNKNIEAMTEKFKVQDVRLKPHFKTHQSQKVGEFFREKGVQGISVSSIEMAMYFADNGWKNITIAFPANPLEKTELLALAKRIDLHLVTTETQTLHELSNNGESQIKWWIKIDVGLGRAGLKFDQEKGILDLAKEILLTPGFSLQGILGHAGHTYDIPGKEAIIKEEKRVIVEMKRLRSFLESELDCKIKISLGDTPGCSLLEDWSGIDEVRPGNFVFFDLMQMNIGACQFEDIALAMACPIVEVNKSQKKAIIHGGAIHFSKDYHKKYKFGQVLIAKDQYSWSGPLESCFLESISQEHGVIYFNEGQEKYFSPGKIIMIMPVHSCLTVDNMGEYFLTPDMERVKIYRRDQ